MIFKNKKEEKIKSKVISIEIVFYDSKRECFSVSYPIGSNVSYITCFYRFYKWFFFRKESEIYSFEYSRGTKIFYRKDIRSIEFLVEEK